MRQPADATSARTRGSRGAAASMPSQSPMLHWSPRHLLQSANTGPMAWRSDGPHDVLLSEADSGGSS